MTKWKGGAAGVIKAIGGIAALLPSAAILLGVVPLPPDVHALLQWLSTGLSLVLIAMMLLFAEAVERWAKHVTALLIGALFCVGVVIATGYYGFARDHIIEQPMGGEQLVLPLHQSKELRSLLAPYGEDYSEALATSIQRERIVELLNDESGSAVLAMVTLLLLAQAFMVAAILLGAVRLAED
jgi:uncharacterized membrane protein YdbT with pleckstrin-like domain